MGKRRIKQSNSAVSEVLGTVLLLGIAVSLFSVVGIIVLSYPFQPLTPSANIIGFVDGDNIILEHRGGENLGLDTKIIVTINNSDSYILMVNDRYILGNESKNNNVWNIGENIIINATKDLPNIDLFGSKVDVAVVDTKTNSVILMGVLKEGSPYTLTVNIVGSGSVGTSPVGPYYYGDTVQLAAIPATGWHFVDWSGDLISSTNPASVTMDGNKAVTATFARNGPYTLTLTKSGTGSGTIQASPSGPYYYGASVTIWANASTGSTFAGFTGALTGTVTPQILVMNGNKAVTATFTEHVTGSITVIKDAVPDDSQIFSFTGDLGSFTLVDNGGTTKSQTFTDLDAGTYTVTETIPSGWYLTDITIVDPSSDSSSTLPSTVTLLNDGFEGGDWDANWDQVSHNWEQTNSNVHSGSYAARSSDGHEGYFVSDNLDASSATSIGVSFWYRLHNTEDNDFYLRYYDGSNYDVIANLGIEDGDTWLHYTAIVTDSQYLKSNFRICFDTSLESDETARVDDVLITKEVAGKANIVLSAGEHVTVTFTNNKLPQTLILRPNAAGAINENDNSGGSSHSNNWQYVDDTGSGDDSSTYVQGNSDNGWQVDTYNVPDQALSGTISNVVVYIRCQKSDNDLTSVSARTAIRLGSGSIEYGTIRDLTTSWTLLPAESYPNKPSTLGGGSWTWTDINNLQIGVSLRSQYNYGWTRARCTQVWVEVTYIP